MEDLQVCDADLSLSGFDDTEIQELISTLPDIPEVNSQVAEDDFDVQSTLDEINEPETRRGDVWKLGPHRLVCGDATDPEDIKRLMEGTRSVAATWNSA